MLVFMLIPIARAPATMVIERNIANMEYSTALAPR
jgi:hypothetical protein